MILAILLVANAHFAQLPIVTNDSLSKYDADEYSISHGKSSVDDKCRKRPIFAAGIGAISTAAFFFAAIASIVPAIGTGLVVGSISRNSDLNEKILIGVYFIFLGATPAVLAGVLNLLYKDISDSLKITLIVFNSVIAGSIGSCLVGRQLEYGSQHTPDGEYISNMLISGGSSFVGFIGGGAVLALLSSTAATYLYDSECN